MSSRRRRGRRSHELFWAMALLLLLLHLLHPIFRPGLPTDGDWARVLLGWMADGERDSGFPYAWDPLFEGGSANHRHPCQGYTGIWSTFLPLPAGGALRLFIFLVTLASGAAFQRLLRHHVRLPPPLAFLGTALLLTAPWWRQRLVGGDVEIVPVLVAPLCFLLLLPPDEGPRGRSRLVLAAFFGALALMGGKPIGLLNLALFACLAWLRPRPNGRVLPSRSRLLLFVGLSLLLSLPRLVSLAEGLRLGRRRAREAASSARGELARKWKIDHRSGAAWRMPDSPPAASSKGIDAPSSGRGSSAWQPSPPPRRRSPSRLLRLPVLLLAAAGLPEALRRGPAPFLVALFVLWVEEPFGRGAILPDLPTPFTGSLASFRPRYLGFHVELFVVLCAMAALRRLHGRRPRIAVVSGLLCLAINLHGWHHGLQGLFERQRFALEAPRPDPLPLVAFDLAELGELSPHLTLAARIGGIGIVHGDRWSPFPSPVEARWLLDLQGWRRNPLWQGRLRVLEGNVAGAELLDARINEVVLFLRSDGPSSILVNLLFDPGLRCDHGRLSPEGGLLRIDLTEGHDGLLMVRYEGTPAERLAWITSPCLAVLCLAWIALGTRKEAG